MNFLIIVYKGIGDVILTTPLIKAIKRYISQSKVYFLTRRYSSQILKNNPYIDDVIIREELNLKKLRSLKIDVSIDYMLSTSSAFYSLVSGAKKRIAFYRQWGFLIYNHMLRTNFKGYNAREKFEYLRFFGINPGDIDDIKPEVYPSDLDYQKAREMLYLNAIDLKKDKIINFDITSPRIYRQLESDKFIFVADRLIEMGYKTLFIPSPDDEEYVKTSILRFSSYKDAHKVITGTSLLELSALISLCYLHIGTSSAPMHIAVSFNIPTFTVYSPLTNPLSWEPPFGVRGYIQDDFNNITGERLWNEVYNLIERLSRGMKNE